MLYEISDPLDVDIKTDSEAFNEAAAFIKSVKHECSGISRNDSGRS